MDSFSVTSACKHPGIVGNYGKSYKYDCSAYAAALGEQSSLREGSPGRPSPTSSCRNVQKACLSKQTPPQVDREVRVSLFLLLWGNGFQLCSHKTTAHQARAVHSSRMEADRKPSDQRAWWCHPQTRERRIKRLCFHVVLEIGERLPAFCWADLTPGGLPASAYVSDKQSGPLEVR